MVFVSTKLTTMIVYSNIYKILVSEDNSVTYSEVLTFMKQHSEIIEIYKSLTTACAKTVRLSVNHLIYARSDHNTKFTPV